MGEVSIVAESASSDDAVDSATLSVSVDSADVSATEADVPEDVPEEDSDEHAAREPASRIAASDRDRILFFMLHPLVLLIWFIISALPEAE